MRFAMNITYGDVDIYLYINSPFSFFLVHHLNVDRAACNSYDRFRSLPSLETIFLGRTRKGFTVP